LVTPEEQLPKFKAFLYSDKEFRENTKAPILPEKPPPVRFATMPESVSDLDNDVKEFIKLFGENDQLITTHPVFGEFKYEEWVLLHYKNVTHHLRQFGLM